MNRYQQLLIMMKHLNRNTALQAQVQSTTIVQRTAPASTTLPANEGLLFSSATWQWMPTLDLEGERLFSTHITHPKTEQRRTFGGVKYPDSKYK